MKKYLYYIPFLILSYPYLSNWYAWLIQDAELVDIVSAVSIFTQYVTPLLIFVWILDISVWLATIFYNGKYKPLLLTYVAIRPIVPNIMRVIWNTASIEWIDWWFIVIFSVISYFSWKELKKLTIKKA